MKNTASYPRLHGDTSATPAVAQAGGVPLAETVTATGLDRELSKALAPWCKPLAVHDPAKIVRDLAMPLALGGDAMADVALLRGEPALFGLSLRMRRSLVRSLPSPVTGPQR